METTKRTTEEATEPPPQQQQQQKKKRGRISTVEEEAMHYEKKDESSKEPVLPWMRSPVDVGSIDECPVNLLPSLDPRLDVALLKTGITSLFPVQVAVWQETVGPGSFERDLCINSPTGSGKTLSYALPIVQMLSTRAIKCLRALVVLPTRPLAEQVKKVFDTIAPAVGLSVGLAVGQSSIAGGISELVKRPNTEAGICYDPEDQSLELYNAVDILVATPGKLMDHINYTKGFTLEHLCYLVVDETDRLLREEYQSWLPTVLHMTQSSEDSLFSYASNSLPLTSGCLKTMRRRGVERGFKDKCYPRFAKMALSATLTQDPSRLAQLDLHHPLFLTTGQTRYQLPVQLKPFILIYELYANDTEGLDRSKTLKAFREGKTQVLVSSDAMTRGMDVEAVQNVINYDKPAHIKTYIHRAGRTARAGQSGRCFTMVHKDEAKHFKKLLKKAGVDSCPVHTIPSDSVEPLRPTYSSALEKLKESLESETHKKRRPNFTTSSRRKE